jgi:hypothetical protein
MAGFHKKMPDRQFLPAESESGLANFWKNRSLFGKIACNCNQSLFQEEQIC